MKLRYHQALKLSYFVMGWTRAPAYSDYLRLPTRTSYDLSRCFDQNLTSDAMLNSLITSFDWGLGCMEAAIIALWRAARMSSTSRIVACSTAWSRIVIFSTLHKIIRAMMMLEIRETRNPLPLFLRTRRRLHHGIFRRGFLLRLRLRRRRVVCRAAPRQGLELEQLLWCLLLLVLGFFGAGNRNPQKVKHRWWLWLNQIVNQRCRFAEEEQCGLAEGGIRYKSCRWYSAGAGGLNDPSHTAS